MRRPWRHGTHSERSLTSSLCTLTLASKIGHRTLLPEMTTASITLFLPRGDAKSMRTAEISNWTGKAIAAPRTELDELLAREELDKAGVYILIGSDPATNVPRAYIGEAEAFRERLKQHKTKEFWVSAIMLALMAEMARAETDTLRERIKSGLAEARRKGVTLGRRKSTKLSAAAFIKHKDVARMLREGHSIRHVAKITGKGVSTVQRVKKAL